VGSGLRVHSEDCVPPCLPSALDSWRRGPWGPVDMRTHVWYRGPQAPPAQCQMAPSVDWPDSFQEAGRALVTAAGLPHPPEARLGDKALLWWVLCDVIPRAHAAGKDVTSKPHLGVCMGVRAWRVNGVFVQEWSSLAPAPRPPPPCPDRFRVGDFASAHVPRYVPAPRVDLSSANWCPGAPPPLPTCAVNRLAGLACALVRLYRMVPHHVTRRGQVPRGGPRGHPDPGGAHWRL
jgi:hypothetical protein